MLIYIYIFSLKRTMYVCVCVCVCVRVCSEAAIITINGFELEDDINPPYRIKLLVDLYWLHLFIASILQVIY